MENNIIHLPGNINASQILYEDNSNIKDKIDDIQTSVVKASDNFNEELENIEIQLNNKTSELNQKISNIVNVSYTETQAITHSSTNTNTIYFSTDTNSIIINGEIYGRGQHLNGVFKLIPSDKTIGSTGYNNTDVIYIQLNGTNFKLYYYSVNNTWKSIENIAFDTNIDASDMSYDISNTPDLGNGDVQSAIEALDGKVFGEIFNKKVVAKNLRNGSPGNLTNTYAVTTYMLPTNGKQSYRFYTTRPNKENCIYHWGFIMSSDASMVGTSQTYGSVSNLVYNSDTNKTRSDWSMLVLADIAALAVGIAEYNTSTQSYSPLRIGDFEGYELGFIPIDLLDRGNGLTEQPKFVDEAYEKRGWWLLSGGINTTGDLSDTSANYSQYYYEVSAGDKVMIRNSSNWSGTPSLCYAVYDKVFTKGVRPTDAVDYLMSDYSDWRTSSFHARGSVGQDYDLIIPQGGKTLVVMARIASDGTWAAYQVPHVYIQRAGQKAKLKDNNYLISTWTDDEIITSTTLAVGSVVSYWSDGTRYGGRGVRLNVKEGDKVLLDTYSPALYGLIFTDENRVVKALYDDRRFDGVWTAPVNGYCYIQDVLYRDNFHYASAHGHLAYMAHDARKHVAKGGDWEMQLAPRKFGETFPQTKHLEGANTYNLYWPTASDWVTMGVLNTFTLVATRVKVENCTASDTLSVKTRYKNTDSNVIVGSSSNNKEQLESGYQWYYRIYRNEVNRTDCALRLYVTGAGTSSSFDLVVDKMFLHSSSDFGELYALAQKIINGKVEVDNFYGVKEKEVDLVKNAIALKSISELGYNILEHGATLPIDEEGYKYAKEIYEKYKNNPPSGQNWGKTNSPFYNNDNTLKLVYLPTIDFSHFKTNGSDYLASAFYGCANLICVGDITLPEECTGTYNNYLNSTFTNCYSLKQIGNISVPMTKICGAYRMCLNCYALEKVGKITSNGMASSSIFQNCYSLERIEEISLKKTPYFAANASPFLNCISLRFMLIKEFGTITGSGTYVLSGATSWGIPNDKHPDARQSLVDSLLTYSYDRVNDPDELGTTDTTCTITLSVNSYNQLTASEIDAITAKGYTVTHP